MSYLLQRHNRLLYTTRHMNKGFSRRPEELSVVSPRLCLGERAGNEVFFFSLLNDLRRYQLHQVE